MYILKFLLLLLSSATNLFTPTEAFDLKQCNQALGMESGAIPDEAITASSSYVPNVGPKFGRLRVERAGGGWCPKLPIEKGVKEYIQIDLNQVHVITGVQTQGRYDRGRGQEYVEEYLLEYWRPGLEEWKEYKRWDSKRILRGNSDTASVESHRLMPIIFASKIRLLPYSIHRRTVCLRMELLGCLYPGGVISYSAPAASDTIHGLYDSSYDGFRSQGILYNGLGRLVDGELGLDNFRLDIGYGKGNGWVAWRNDSSNNGYVELVFQFNQLRNFSKIILFSNNFFSRNVQVFSKAKIFFSIGGKFYKGPVITYNYMPDKILENARNVSISLHNRTALFIKLQLFFADQIIMLSEVTFESELASVNVTEEDGWDLEENEVIITSNGETTLKAFETISARKSRDTYVEVIIGVLTAIMLLLLVVFFVILIINRRHKIQGSPTLFRNPFGVKMNMKDLLMNFSSNNTQNGVPPAQNVPLTPVIHHDSCIETATSMTYEEYRSSLTSNHYGTNYTVLRHSTNIESQADNDEDDLNDSTDEIPPEVPPLPDTPTLNSPVTPVSNHTTYRSLQMTSANGCKSTMMDLLNYFPHGHQESDILPDDSRAKTFYTTPREKHRLTPPMVCWNIVPSITHSYSCREVELTPIPRYSLQPVEKLGSCHAGELSLYETKNLNDIMPGVCRLVAVRTSNPDKFKGDPVESLREIRFLAGLNDPNICKVLGVCTAEAPPLTIIEYGEMGDLAQYLQFLVNRNGSVRSAENQPLSGSLIYMATQIASAMKYLESKHVVHKDLAARNCLVGRGYIVKVADIAMSKPQYRKEYAEIGGRPPAPIRWLPWESILLDRYTCYSAVWAFAVTLWEILHFCCDRPFANLSNEKVIQNAEHMYYGGQLQVVLNKPPHCSTNVYELMHSCWCRDDTDRPTFKTIYSFLKRINKDYVISE